jgi:hypothetical protein
MSLLRIWFGLTALLVGSAFIYAYVPILIPFIAIAGGLGALTAGIVTLARAVERRWM